MSNKCDKFLYTEKGNIIKEFRNDFSKLRDNELNCFLDDKRKFVRIYFPGLIGYDVEKIIDKICMFISNSEEFYYLPGLKINEKNRKNINITLVSKKTLIYYKFYLNILSNINLKNYKNIDEYIDKDIKYNVFFELLINNSKNFIKNNIIHYKFKRCYKNDYIKKKINNFYELYKEIYNLYEPNIKKINEDSIKFKGQINKDMSKYVKEMSKYSFEELNNFKGLKGKKIINYKLKRIHDSVSFYLKYIPEYYDKEYVRKEVIKKLRKKKIKYKL
jgi:hypothetical protein